MDALASEVYHKANSREKALLNEPLNSNNPQLNSNFEPPSITLCKEERAQKNGSQDKGTSLFDEESTKLDHTKPKITPQEEAEKGNSSRPRLTPPRKPIICKFCGQEFFSTQALGGHQNAHKEEREMQKAMKEAYEFGGSSFYYHFPGTSTPTFHGSYYGHPFQSHYYHRFVHIGRQPRSTYLSPNAGLELGSPGLVRTLDQNLTQTRADPTHDSGWPRPYVHASGPIKRPRETTNFGLPFTSNLTTPLQEMQNKDGFAKKQCNESMELNLSLKCTESEKQNKSTELDLTLKL